MSDDSDDNIGSFSNSALKKNKKSVILSDDSDDEQNPTINREDSERNINSNSNTGLNSDDSDHDTNSKVNSARKYPIKSFASSDDSDDDSSPAKNRKPRNGENISSDDEKHLQVKHNDLSKTMMCSDYSESDDQESKSLDACLLNGNNKIKRAQSAPLDSSDEDSTSNVIKAAIAASNQKLLQENSTSENEDNDSSDNAIAKSNNKSEKKIRKRIKKSAKSRPDDSDSSDDNGGNDNDNANSSMATDNIAGSDSSCSNSPVPSSEDELPVDSRHEKSSKSIRAKPDKKQSRKAKEDAMKEIYSEANRMLRESAVGLPYHRPRQRTLDEFLNRKKALPDVLPVLSGLKISRGSGQNASFTTPDLFVDEAEKILQEREKKAENFFKEEVENESNCTNINTEETVESEPNQEESNCEAIVNKLETNSSEQTDDQAKKSEIEEKKLSEVIFNEPANFKNDLGSSEEMSRALILEEDSSDDNENNKELENVFLPSKLDSDWPAIEGTLAKVGSPKLGKGKFDLRNNDLNNFIVFEVENNEEYKEDAGLSKLKNRFVKHVKGNQSYKNKSDLPSKPVEMTIVSKQIDSEGREHLKTEKLNYVSNTQSSKPSISFEKVRIAKKSARIGAQHLSLKQILKEKIDQKRKEEWIKKEEQKKIDNEEEDGGGNESEDDEEEEILDDEETSEEDSEEEEDEEVDWDDEEAKLREMDRRDKRKRIKQGSFLDDEAEDEDMDNELENSFDETSQVDDVQITENRQKAQNLETNENIQSDQNIISTPLLLDESSMSMLSRIDEDANDNSVSVRKKLGFEELFDTTDPKVDDMDDVVGLCSGQFLTQPASSKLMTQDLKTYATSQQDVTQELCDTPDTVILSENLTQVSNVARDSQHDSSNFEIDTYISKRTEMAETKDKTVENEILQPGFMQDDVGALDLLKTSSEDEKEEIPREESSKKKNKKMKKRKRVVISDDSDSDEDKNTAVCTDEDVGKDEKEVYYDSEENEIEVENTKLFKGFKSKKGALRKEFVEQEAELSGDSDDGLNISEDEDERGLDRLMLEEGDLDEECADEDELRDQVGRLHQRALLDQDQREIRLFQEAFLEDGELHSDATRTRKFRWKDTEEDIDLERRPSDDETEENEGATLQDEKWRLERLEREKFIKETEIGKINKSKIRNDVDQHPSNDEDSDNDDSQFFNLATKALQKLNKSNVTISNSHTGSATLPSAGGDTILAIANDISDHNSNAQKQFRSPKGRAPLQIVSSNPSSVRGSFLSRGSSTLEKLAEMTKSSSEARTGSGAKNTKNFVFALLSPEKKKNSDASNTNQAATIEEPKSKSKGSTSRSNKVAPDSKKIKIDRSIDENSSDTIFGFM